MRVLLDGTPLLGRPTGVARYTRGLLDGLLALDDGPEVALLAMTRRGPAPLRDLVPVAVRGRPVPARVLHALWGRAGVPTAEWLAGAAAGIDTGIDVVHGTNFVLPPRRTAAGVVAVHDLQFALDPRSVTASVRAYDRLVRRAIAGGALVSTLTAAMRQQVLDHYGLAPDRVAVVRPGVDDRWRTATPAVLPGLPSEFLLYVGSLDPRKDLPVLLDGLRRRGMGLPLVLAGPPGDLDLGGLPAGSVVHAGYVDDDALPGLVAAARALVLPSRHEGLGLTALEALAAGTPVLCSDLPVLREVLGAQATYLPVGDVAAWADALVDPADPASGRAARQAQTAPWTWQRCAMDAVAAYARALAG